MTDPRLDRALSDAITDLAGSDPQTYLDDILERTGRTRQRPWWTFPGRYFSMTTALKFAVTAGLAFVIGAGVTGFDNAKNGDPTPASGQVVAASDVPAKVTARPTPASATSFEGKLGYAGRSALAEDGSTVWLYRMDEINDARLDGVVRLATRSNLMPGTSQQIWHGSLRIENGDGTWTQTPHLVVEYPDGLASTHTTVLVGDGAYDGLVAITEMTYRPQRIEGTYDIRGYIFEGAVDDEPGFGIPPAPDAWSAAGSAAPGSE